jgi:hypothetical protein
MVKFPAELYVTEETLKEETTEQADPATEKFTHALAIPVIPFCVARTPVSLFSVLTTTLPAIIFSFKEQSSLNPLEQ